jgi:hypothetical protein
VSECDGEASILRRPWTTRGAFAPWVGRKALFGPLNNFYNGELKK